MMAYCKQSCTGCTSKFPLKCQKYTKLSYAVSQIHLPLPLKATSSQTNQRPLRPVWPDLVNFFSRFGWMRLDSTLRFIQLQRLEQEAAVRLDLSIFGNK